MVLLIFFISFGGTAWATKNPRPLPAVGFCQSFRSTSTNGVANYDDYQNDSLWDVFQYCDSHFTGSKQIRQVLSGTGANEK
jgi:hypothetical protein